MKILLVGIILATLGCSDPGPKKIKTGTDVCAFCQMTIVDERFTCQLVSTKNKTYLFDDIKCLNNFIEAKELKAANTKEIYVANFQSAGSFIEIKNAHFLHSNEFHSPMGGNIAAFANTASRNDAMIEMSGEIFNVDQVVLYH
jgi:copper chaperone NosL